MYKKRITTQSVVSIEATKTKNANTRVRGFCYGIHSHYILPLHKISQIFPMKIQIIQPIRIIQPLNISVNLGTTLVG